MPSKSSIYPFLGIAMVIHVALGLLLFQDKPQLSIPSQKGAGISVTLAKNTISVQAKKITTPQQTEIPTTTNIEKKQTKKLTTPATKTQETQEKQTIQTNVVSEQKSVDSLAKIIGIIQKKIKHHFYYPRIAQIKNWQGTVLLTLIIEKTGKIKQISVAKSSGHDVLDHAALEVVNKIKDQNFIAHFVINKRTIQLPISYQLTEG